ncbi:MAG: carbohydrate ABC transporter permease [Nocardioidaceae bacterium]
MSQAEPKPEKERTVGALLLGPAVILVVAVLFAPTIYVGVQSFFDWQPNRASPFIGFDNYVAVLGSDEFQQVMLNQAFFLLGLPVWIVVPLLISFLLYEKTWLPGLWRTIYFLPAVLSPALVGIMFRAVLAPDGPLNAALRSVGLGRLALDWLTNPDLVKPVIIGLILWASTGVGVVIFSAALSAVPRELFEVAALDGAGWLRRLWHVVIPAIRDSLALWVAYQVLSLFLFMFGWIYVLTSGGPGLSSTTIDYLIYQEVFRFGQFGTAAAEAMLMILVVLAILGLPAWLSRRRLKGVSA